MQGQNNSLNSNQFPDPTVGTDYRANNSNLPTTSSLDFSNQDFAPLDNLNQFVQTPSPTVLPQQQAIAASQTNTEDTNSDTQTVGDSERHKGYQSLIDNPVTSGAPSAGNIQLKTYLESAKQQNPTTDTTQAKSYNSNPYISPNELPTGNIQPKTYSEAIANTSLIFKGATILVASLLFIVTVLVLVSFLLPNTSIGIWLNKNTFLKELAPKNQTNLSSIQKSSSSSSSDATINSEQFLFQAGTNPKSTIQIIEDSLPSVLSISLKSKGDGINLSQDLSAGTGYIVTSDGLVVTNKHVVSIICKNDADRIQISGLTHDQKVYNLTLKSIDPIDDLAILKIDAVGEKFPTISFANSENLKLGQDVVAIGNVLGELQNTVTRGIVSGLNRSFETEIKDQCTGLNFQADNLIQTDAAINRGNSGGPLFNSSGLLIGMNTLGTVDAQNIGLAIPSYVVTNILQAYSNNNSIVRARLGLSSLQINAVRKAQNSWIPTDYGELVFRQQGSPVDSNSAASEAGIKEGDIILEFNGKQLVTTTSNPSPIRREVLNSQAGQKIQLKVLKAKSKTQTGFIYDKDPVNVDVILGSTYFDLKTKQVVSN